MSFFRSMLLPGRRPPGDIPAEDLRRYRRIWRSTVLLTLIVAIAPLGILAALNLSQHEERLRARHRFDLTRSISSTSHSLESILHERLAALELLSRESTPEELSDPARLASSFASLRAAFRGSGSGAYGGFVDLGLIDATGRQVCYVGPYNLQNAQYEQQTWFHEVVVRGKHVSDVFMGHRQIPHFVITVKKESESAEFHMLRATLDVTLLTHLLTPVTATAGDIFLTNREGILQTSSKTHGTILDACEFPVPPYSPHVEIREDVDADGRPYLLGWRHIADTGFVLMAVMRQPDLQAEMGPIRTEIVSLLLGSIALVVLVVLSSVTSVVRRIRDGDRKRTEVLHAVEYTNKMATIGRLAATVAHEINNPLAIINEQSGLMQDVLRAEGEFDWKGRFLRSIDSIRRAVQRGSAVTHRLLGFTRRLDVKREEIDLATLMREVLGFLDHEARHRSVDIKTAFQDDACVESDRGKLQQVFLNLLSNAFAAVSDGGRIELAIRPAPDRNRVSIEVRDDGPGIAPEDLDRVFEPFFTTKGDVGTGLGLSITRQLVRELGGEIRLESEVGRGSCFAVELPRTPPTGGGAP